MNFWVVKFVCSLWVLYQINYDIFCNVLILRLSCNDDTMFFCGREKQNDVSGEDEILLIRFNHKFIIEQITKFMLFKISLSCFC